MLTIKQVAAQLKISTNSVYQAVQKGQIPSHRFGSGRGTIRISEEDLAIYVDSCRQEQRTVEPRPKPLPATKLKHIRLSS